MKQYIKNNVDTQLNNQCFGKFNMLDNVELEIKVLTNGDVGEAWEQPTFELIGVKMDKNEVRQTEGFEVLSLTEHTVKVALDEQFTTKDGVLDMQLVVKDNGRVSTCIFSFVVGKSLEGNIVESIRKIDTLDNLDAVVANLRDYEQRIDQINTEVVATNEDIKIEEAKRKQDELVRVTKETARANAEAIRQVNEEMRISLYETAAPSEEERQANEETRMVNETNRKIAEQTRISNENSRILAEQNRNETFETNEGVRNLQENKRVANENARINKFGEFEKNEIIRLASENNRLIQEIERVNNEENRINAEANRQAQENNREATYTRFNEKEKERQKAEDARQVAEQQRVNAELLRDQNYAKAETNRNKLYEDCEAQRNADFGEAETIRHETYTASEKERYTAYNQAELTRNQNEELRKNNESKRITNENTRIANEELRVQKEATRDAKVEEFLTRGEQTVIEIEQRTEEFLARGEQVISDIEKRTDAALEILEGSAEEVADMRIDYMGNTHENMRQAANANVDYAVKTAIGEFNYLDYEGQHITANNSIEGHTKSAILSGQTLVNLATITNRYPASHGWNTAVVKLNYALSENSKYLVNVFNLPSDMNYVLTDSTNSNWIMPLYVNKKTVFVSQCNSEDIITLHVNNSTYRQLTQEEIDKIQIILVEYQDGMENWNIPYFEGMQSVTMPSVTMTGKNLFDYKSYTNCEGLVQIENGFRVTSWAYKKPFKNFLKPNTWYQSSYLYNIIRPSVGAIDNGGGKLAISNGSKYILITGIKGANISFRTPEDIETYYELFFYADGGGGSDVGEVEITNIQIEEGSTATSYEPYKSNILSCLEPVELLSKESTLNATTGEFYEPYKIKKFISSQNTWGGLVEEPSGMVRMITTDFSDSISNENNMWCNELPVVAYSGSWNINNECIANATGGEIIIYLNTNGVVTTEAFFARLDELSPTIIYKSLNPVHKTVDLSDNVVYSYNGTTHYSCSSEEGSLVPTLSVKVPTDVQATIAQQRNTIVALEAENEALKDGLIEANQYREDGDMDLLSNQWDIDFRLFEIEMTLDMPMMATFKTKETDIMSRYLQAKTLILGGRYERAKMEYQLKRYLEAGQLTQEEYDELISLMDARELVE